MSTPLVLDKLMIAEFAAEVMVYFERHKIMDIVTRLVSEIVLVRPNDAQLWIAQNITRIANEVYSNCLQLTYNRGLGGVSFYELPGRYLYRVVIHGRCGSGRKTQARMLVKHFNLVYIDTEQIIYHCLRHSDEVLGKELQRAFEEDKAPAKSEAVAKVLFRRLVQMDALRQGWVVVNFPNTVQDLQQLFEHCKTPPNKLIYLQCPELMAKQRLVAQPNLGSPQNNCNYIEAGMNHYQQNEQEINEYLARRHETINVDGTPCYEVVKNCVLSEISRKPYVMGFKA